VHPTKIEARFNKKLDILNFISKSIKSKLKELFKVLPDIDIKSKIHQGSDALGLDLDLNTLIDITAVDFPAKEQRFDVIYHFLSMSL